MNEELKRKLIELSVANTNEASLEMERLLEEAIKNDPQDTELLLKIAVLEFKTPFVDDEKGIAALQKIFEYDPDNAYALMLLACINYFLLGVVNKNDLLSRLSFLETGNNELDSMLRYTATWYYDYDYHNPAKLDINKRVEKLLLESIKKCQSHVKNYAELARLYFHQNRYDEALMAVKQAIKNVEKVYGDKIESCDDSDVQEFLNEYITGIHITKWAYRELKAFESEIIIRKELIQDPLDIDLLLRLSIIESTYFVCTDYEKRIITLEKILAIDPDNLIALLMLTYVMHYYKKSVDESLFQKLISIKTSDPELNSLLLYVASWYYEGKDDKKQEELLRQSIATCAAHSNHYIALAHLCFKQNRIDEANNLRQKALKNVVKVFSAEVEDNFISDVEFFLNECFKGIYRSQSAFEYLKKLL